MKFEIKHLFTDAVLFAQETESLQLCVEAAVKSSADLCGADLCGADLCGADLCGAVLGGAYLCGANLRGANLGGADLRGANLGGANLGGAKLGGAKLKATDGTELILASVRPVLQLGPLGSRSDYLVAFVTDHGVYVRAGCFFDTLDAFRAAVESTHGANEHAQEYAAAAALIECHARLWTPIAEEAA